MTVTRIPASQGGPGQVLAAPGRDLVSDQPKEQPRHVQYGSCRTGEVADRGDGFTAPSGGAPGPAHYTARPGDTLSGIARHEYGNAADWPALWWINRQAVPNPDVLAAGQRLRLSTWHPRQAWLDRAARPPSRYRRGRRASAPTAAVAATTAPAPAPPAGTSPAEISTAAPGSFQACVIARESGGNAQAVNPASGAGGLPVPARHLAEPGVLRAAARRARQRAERGIPAGIRPVGHQPMGTLRRVLTGPFSRSTV